MDFITEPSRNIKENNTLEACFPEVSKQWDYDKNIILPSQCTYGSSKYAWWICDKGHSYSASIKNRSKGRGCPYCSGKKVLAGYNDLFTTHPEIVELWSEKNTINPKEVSAGTHKKAWWECGKGHQWEASICKVASEKRRCPYCSNNLLMTGFNDLATVLPEIASQWHPSKNDKSASEVFPKTNKKAWWICSKGHEWQASPNSRSNGHGCPVCAGKKALSGDNSLADTHPELVKEWDYERNGDFSPENTRRGSHFQINWICSKGHNYKATISDRTNPSKKRGCPYCSGRKVIVGLNDMATTHPDMQCFHDDGSKVDMTTISAGSGISYMWKCDNGHKTYAPAYQAIKWMQGCPQCSEHGTSSSEKEIIKYVESITESKILSNDRSIINPYELDIYIPGHNLAIEFNGLYWHTEERGKDKHYHYTKWKKCKEAGIQLITIWEDEWRDKQDIVKSMIAHKLGVSQDRRVYARKTVVKTIGSSQSQDFLNNNHIQGGCSSSSHVGLFNNEGELIAVSSWRKNKNTLYLDRYATSCTVVGGMGKMLKKGKEIAKEYSCTDIVTFSDHSVSNGNLYENLGFNKDEDLKPDYSYVVKGERKHKFGYRIKKFKQDPQLIYKEGLTEKELAQLNGLERIWDCGKTRWVIKV